MPDYPADTLAERLQIACRGLSCARVGVMTGTNPETARRYLKYGNATPRFLAGLCAGLDLSAEWLLNNRGPMKRSQLKVAWLAEAPPLEIYQALGQSLDQLVRAADGRTKALRLSRS